MLRSGAGTYPRQRFVFTAGSKPLAAWAYPPLYFRPELVVVPRPLMP
jgi:hypothetical protein